MEYPLGGKRTDRYRHAFTILAQENTLLTAKAASSRRTRGSALAGESGQRAERTDACTAPLRCQTQNEAAGSCLAI